MNGIEVVTREAHGSKHWLAPSNFAFAAKDTIVPLGLNEVPAAMLTMPLCIVRTPDGIQLAGLMGLQSGENLFVAQNGAWLVGHIPAQYGCYPFLRARAEDGRDILCVRTEALTSDAARGESFYDADGKPTEALQRMLTRLGEQEAGLRQAQTALAVLDSLELIEPWPIQVRSGDKTVVASDLHRVNEARLNELSPDGLEQLRNCGGLLLAFAQLLSMAQIQLLSRIAFRQKANEKRPAPASPSPALPLNLIDDHGLISFGNL